MSQAEAEARLAALQASLRSAHPILQSVPRGRPPPPPPPAPPAPSRFKWTTSLDSAAKVDLATATPRTSLEGVAWETTKAIDKSASGAGVRERNNGGREDGRGEHGRGEDGRGEDGRGARGGEGRGTKDAERERERENGGRREGRGEGMFRGARGRRHDKREREERRTGS